MLRAEVSPRAAIPCSLRWRDSVGLNAGSRKLVRSAERQGAASARDRHHLATEVFHPMVRASGLQGQPEGGEAPTASAGLLVTELPLSDGLVAALFEGLPNGGDRFFVSLEQIHPPPCSGDCVLSAGL